MPIIGHKFVGLTNQKVYEARELMPDGYVKMVGGKGRPSYGELEQFDPAHEDYQYAAQPPFSESELSSALEDLEVLIEGAKAKLASALTEMANTLAAPTIAEQADVVAGTSVDLDPKMKAGAETVVELDVNGVRTDSPYTETALRANEKPYVRPTHNYALPPDEQADPNKPVWWPYRGRKYQGLNGVVYVVGEVEGDKWVHFRRDDPKGNMARKWPDAMHLFDSANVNCYYRAVDLSIEMYPTFKGSDRV